MSIGASIAAFAAALAVEAYINDRRVYPISGRADLGFDAVSSSAELVLPEDPGGINLRDPLEIRLGWDGRTLTVFTGEVVGVEEAFDAGGAVYVVTGSGPLARAQLQYWDEVPYAGMADEDIVDDLLTKAGIGARSILGAGEVLGVVQDVTLEKGTAPWDLINEIDQVVGYKTWDGPDGVVRRRRISGNPAGTPSTTYTQGVDIFSVRRPRLVRGIHNHVIVTGLAQETLTPESERFADNPLVPNPPQYITYRHQSDLIEDGTLADVVSLRLITEVNRVVEEVPLVTKGDPRRVPGETIRVTASRLGLGSGALYWCKHVSHQFGPGGYDTTLTLEGGIGTAGETTNIPPIAVFTFRVTRETWLVAGTPTDFWTVTCDGSASYDTDGVIAVYAWTNNKNADVSATAYYSTTFTAAEIATATITLTVTDDQGATGFVTQSITAAASATMVRDLYIAAGSRAEATADGGKTWQTWTPGAGTVRSTPAIAGDDHSYFGLSDGKLYRTDDYVATAPTLVHDFGSQVNAIWIHEENADRVTVGLANGEIHNTTNASALGSSTWNLLTTYGSAVWDIVESGAVAGQYRVSIGDSVRITYDEFVSDAAVITFPSGTARQIIPSIIGLPGKATATGTGPVRSEDGTVYTYATTAPTDVYAGTHHIRLSILLVVDRTGKVWKTADAGTVFTNIATLPASDPANRAIRDGDNQEIFYVAADDGAYKSFDGGLTWKLLRDYAGGSLVGQQIGYGDLRPEAVPHTLVVSDVDAKALNLWNGSSNDTPPADWQTPGFNDTAWAAAVVTNDIDPVGTSETIWSHTVQQSNTDECLFRQDFALPAGRVDTAVFTYRANDIQRGAWLNGIFLGSELTDSVGSDIGPDLVVTVDPAILLPGATNYLAVYAANKNPAPNSPPEGGASATWVLEINAPA